MNSSVRTKKSERKKDAQAKHLKFQSGGQKDKQVKPSE